MLNLQEILYRGFQGDPWRDSHGLVDALAARKYCAVHRYQPGPFSESAKHSVFGEFSH